MKTIVCALAIILPLTAAPATFAADTGAVLPGLAIPSATTNQLVADHGNGVEHMTGNDAMAHIRNLRARKAKALAEAEKRLRDRGWKPTELAHVIRSTSTARHQLDRTNPNYSRVQYISDGSGELDLWSWDDGDDSTWEGVVYYEDYTTGLSVTWDAQIDVTTSSPYPVWETEVAAEQGGTDLLTVQAVRNKGHVPSPFAVIAANATARPDLIRDVTRGVLQNDAQLVRLPRPVRDWLACTVAGCGGAALGCLYGGPAWGPCFGLWCGGTALGCAAAVAITYLL